MRTHVRLSAGLSITLLAVLLLAAVPALAVTDVSLSAQNWRCPEGGFDLEINARFNEDNGGVDQIGIVILNGNGAVVYNATDAFPTDPGIFRRVHRVGQTAAPNPLSIQILEGTTVVYTGNLDSPCFPASTGAGPGINDGRINFGDAAPVTVYPLNGSFANGFEVWRIIGATGYRYITVSNAQLASIPARPATNTLLGSSGDVAVYRLTGGDYQINVGPDASGRVLVFIFDGLPPSTIRRADFVGTVGGAPVTNPPATGVVPGTSGVVQPGNTATVSVTGIVYVVQPGDTLGRIATRYGTSVSALVAANGIVNPNRIEVGQVIIIPVPGSTTVVTGTVTTGVTAPVVPPATSTTVTGTRVHVVQPGENLFRIALRYGTSVGAIAAANGIVDPTRIYVGQTLVIP